MPLSAVVADADVLGVLRPGQHGSTFGGNPLACAVGRAVVSCSDDGPDGMLERARDLGAQLHDRLAGSSGTGSCAVRGVGLWAGVDVDPGWGDGRAVSEAMARRGVLVKDTHGATIRLSPPLVVTGDELDCAVDALGDVARALTGAREEVGGGNAVPSPIRRIRTTAGRSVLGVRPCPTRG